MLVILLVVWVIAIPVVTVAGAYVRSRFIDRRSRARAQRSTILAATPVLRPTPVLTTPALGTTPVGVATARDG